MEGILEKEKNEFHSARGRIARIGVSVIDQVSDLSVIQALGDSVNSIPATTISDISLHTPTLHKPATHPFIGMMMTFPTLLVLHTVVCVSKSTAFHVPVSTVVGRSRTKLMQMFRKIGEDYDATLNCQQERRDFLVRTICVGSAIITPSFVSFPSIVRANDDYIYKRGEEGDLTSQLFNPDGSLRDPNYVVTAQENAVDLMFSIPSNNFTEETNEILIMSTDGVQPKSSFATNSESAKIKASYKLPLKWNREASSTLPLYYDSSEGKNGKSCNRITVYSITSPSNKFIDMMVLEKASKVGVAQSLFMDQIPNNYFDQGVLKADLVSGRTVRKPIQNIREKNENDEQVYYEFDLAFAPLKCDGFMEGNKENLGLGFCPYDNIFLVSATVVKNSDNKGTLICCVVECNKDEWKMANSDLKRVRSSFTLDRA